MSELNYLCRNDISDEDCKKCAKYGIIFDCPMNCKHFDDIRSGMSNEMQAERASLMAMLGTQDELPWEGNEW